MLAFPVWIGMTGWLYDVFVTFVSIANSHPRDSYFTLQDGASKLLPVPKKVEDSQNGELIGERMRGRKGSLSIKTKNLK